jgi:2-amino-4-hydroxy-6-hydroxymethyldihydropteridine diphosphokinase
VDRVGRAAVSLGSNLGDRRAHLDYAVSRLRGCLNDAAVSTYFETVPFDVPGEQPAFLNAAFVGDWDGTPRDLLNQLLAIESERGRERPFPRAARTLDLDLILFGDQVISEPGLIVPHPHFRERRFVLEPLAQIAPNLRDPLTGRTIEQLLSQLVG